MPGIPGAQDVRLPVCSRVQHSVVVRVGERDGLEYPWLNEMRHLRESSCEAICLVGGDSIPKLNPRVKQHPLNLVENEPRQNQRV